MVSEQRPHSRVSGEYSVFGGGYPNPAYSSGTTQQEESTLCVTVTQIAFSSL